MPEYVRLVGTNFTSFPILCLVKVDYIGMCKLSMLSHLKLFLVPDMSIWGALSSMHVNLDYSQYGLILGFLNQNLGEPLEAFERPSSFVVDPVEDQAVGSYSYNICKTIRCRSDRAVLI